MAARAPVITYSFQEKGKKERPTFFILRKVGKYSLYSRQSCAQLNFRRFITKEEGENGCCGMQLTVSPKVWGAVAWESL